MVDIKKVFYEGIVKEAMAGKIDVYQYYNIIFNTIILEEDKEYGVRDNEDDVLVPTLMIKNKELFDELLIEYVNLAIDFYDNNNFLDEVVNNNFEHENLICKEKAIMALLFANATVEDFNNPVGFLRRRIDFIKNFKEEHVDCGYSEILGANLTINVNKDVINNETPGQFVVEVSDGYETFVFPRIKFGISDDTIYIYAIQNKMNEGNLAKKINRRLYKIGEGYKDENDFENPKDVTASFLVVLNMFVNYFMAKGYKKLVVPSILIERWNAKRMAIHAKYKLGKLDEKKRNELILNQEMIQSNLTNKLIRTLLRLACHYNNIDILSLPYENDSCLHVRLNDDIRIMCNNALLLETGKIMGKAVIKKEISR